MPKIQNSSRGKTSRENAVENMGTVVKKYDDLKRCTLILTEGIETEFHKFVNYQEGCRKKWLSVESENSNMKQSMAKYKAERDTLDIKLKHARNQLDSEMKKRLKAEQAVDHMARQIQLIRELILDKENANALSNHDRQALVQSLHQVSNIDVRVNKDNLPTQSLLNQSYTFEESSSLLSEYDRTEDDFLDETGEPITASARRSMKRSISSAPMRTIEDTSEDSDVSKKQRVVTEQGYGSYARRKKFRRKREVERTVEAHVQLSHGGSPLKDIQPIGRLDHQFPKPSPSPNRRPPSQGYLKSSSSKDDLTDLSIDSYHTLPVQNNNESTPSRSARQDERDNFQKVLGKQTSVPNLYPSLDGISPPNAKTKFNTISTPRRSPRKALVMHTFVTKIAVRMETCGPCGKRLRFGSSVAKCRDCKAIAHPECKDAVPKPCQPVRDTPGKKREGAIDSYIPGKGKVPTIVVSCVEDIEERGLRELGLYRVPGNDKDVKELKEKFLRGKSPDLTKYLDIHVVCGCLKDFLRGLSEPLVTFALHESFMVAATIADDDDSLSALYQCVSELPQANRDTLAYMMVHLQKVAGSAPTQMGIENLSKVFGPTLIGHRSANPSHMEMLEDIKAQPVVVAKLLGMPSDYWNQFRQAINNTPPYNPSWRTPNTPATPEEKPVPRSTMLGPIDDHYNRGGGMSPVKKKGSFHALTPKFGSKHKDPSKRPKQFFDSPH